MQKLIASVQRFRAEHQADFQQRHAHLVKGQSPSAMLITCADSRMTSTLVAGAEPGELFVVRNAGNFAPPYEGSEAAADCSVAAAVGFGVGHLGIRDIVVCGHSHCGAMQGLLNGREQLSEPSLRAWLRHGDVALERVRKQVPATELDVDTLARENVLLQMEHLATHPAVREHKARLHGFFFELATAEIYAYDPVAKRFLVLDEEQARRLQGELD